MGSAGIDLVIILYQFIMQSDCRMYMFYGGVGGPSFILDSCSSGLSSGGPGRLWVLFFMFYSSVL